MFIKKNFGEKVFDILNICFLSLLGMAALYPFLYVLFASFSVPSEFASFNGFLIRPLGFVTYAYQAVFENEDIWVGYRNTLFYVIVGTSFNIFMTSLAAYVISRRNFLWNRFIIPMIIFTMFFSGGLIPNFLLIKQVGFYNTVWALMIPGVISTWNLFIMRNNFKAIPASLEESATIDGANDMVVLFRIILPLSLPVIAVMVLYYGVGHWNSWFGALIYLRKRSLFPLQLFLREIIISNDTKDMVIGIDMAAKESVSETIKYATIIVATLPILCLYPFLQKYFVKGVMIGALKG